MRIQTTHICIFLKIDYDCSNLPVNYEKFDRGCRGAVLSSGSPSGDYCTNGYYPWYKKCCKWENKRCRPIAPSDGK